MPYRCRGKGCRNFFSVKVGTVMQDSKLGYQEWAIAIYLYNTNLKSASSMKLHRDLGISQKSAWHLAHRIRQCWDDMEGEAFAGRVEADETYMSGRAKNMHAMVRRERIHGRGGVDKTAVAELRDRVGMVHSRLPERDHADRVPSEAPWVVTMFRTAPTFSRIRRNPRGASATASSCGPPKESP